MIDYTITLNADGADYFSHSQFRDYYEIILVVKGSVFLFLNKQLRCVTSDTLLRISPTMLYHSTAVSEEQCVLHVLRISEQFLKKFSTDQTDLFQCFSGPTAVKLEAQHISKVSELLELCRQESDLFGADLRRQSGLLEILLFSRELGLTSPAPHVETNRSFQRVVPILDYIDEHLAGSLSLATLAEQFYISRQHLCRIFKGETGFSAKEYVSRVRILKACALLREGWSVRETGEAVGFLSNSHFIRTFGQIVGQPPGKYAKQYYKKPAVKSKYADTVQVVQP